MNSALVKNLAVLVSNASKEKGWGIHNQAADGKFSFGLTQLAQFKLRNACEPRGNGAFLYSLYVP